jgi:hypothetical protein
MPDEGPTKAKRDWSKPPRTFEGSSFGKRPQGFQKGMSELESRRLAQLRVQLAKAERACGKGNRGGCQRAQELKIEISRLELAAKKKAASDKAAAKDRVDRAKKRSGVE